eukprot:7753655-Ditylum_brightwellii.AAC.1
MYNKLWTSAALLCADHLSSAAATVILSTAVAETSYLISSPAQACASLTLVVMAGNKMAASLPPALMWCGIFNCNTIINVAMH